MKKIFKTRDSFVLKNFPKGSKSLNNFCSFKKIESGCSRARLILFLVFSEIIIFNSGVKAQRTVDMSQYSQAYFDSIRSMVYDTTNVNYTIHA
ncbi:MAG TPA: hypothetical protein VKA38_07015, partial [Draconibacterium sp.]|nr:hypothetical protein [Draconibacterium sp.]